MIDDFLLHFLYITFNDVSKNYFSLMLTILCLAHLPMHPELVVRLNKMIMVPTEFKASSGSGEPWEII